MGKIKCEARLTVNSLHYCTNVIEWYQLYTGRENPSMLSKIRTSSNRYEALSFYCLSGYIWLVIARRFLSQFQFQLQFFIFK